MANHKVQSYKDLEAWRISYELAREVYRYTKEFPKEELYGLTAQIRRCATSIPSNIAEGFHRQTIKEKIQFYHIASGSTAELQTQLMLASDMQYLSHDAFNSLMVKSQRSHKLTYGLLRSIRKQSKDSSAATT